MRKTWLSLLAVFFALTSVSVSHAEEPLTQRLAKKINQFVKSAQEQAIPKDLTTNVLVRWWEHGTLVHKNPRYEEEGSFALSSFCQAVLCNYKEEGKTMVVTVAFDNRCFQAFDKDSKAPFYLFSVYLGDYGSYTAGQKAGQPYTFEMEIDRGSQKRNEVFKYQKTPAGMLYTLNMPVRTEGLQKTLKSIFAKQGTVSLENAARYLKYSPEPSVSSTFSAD